MKRFLNYIGCHIEIDPGFYKTTKDVIVLVDSSDKFKLVSSEPEYVCIQGHNVTLKVHYTAIRKIFK